jgi:hypothetical protein
MIGSGAARNRDRDQAGGGWTIQLVILALMVAAAVAAVIAM